MATFSSTVIPPASTIKSATNLPLPQIDTLKSAILPSTLSRQTQGNAISPVSVDTKQSFSAKSAESPISPTTLAILDDKEPVTSDQIVDTLTGTALGAAIISSQLKDDGKFCKRIEDMKDHVIMRKTEIQRHETAPTVQKSLWNLRKALVLLDLKLKKVKTTVLLTADQRRKKIDRKMVDVQLAYDHLMMDLAMTIAGKSSQDASQAFGSMSKLAIASGHPDWEVLDENSAMKICMQGDKYLFGYGVLRSYDLAFKRYMAAAKFGLAEAANMLGCMFEYGLGREPDLPTAVYWYKEAVKKNYAESYNNLGRIHETGKGMPKDYNLAIEYYLKASELDHPDAQTNLGYMLENGIGTPADIKKAESWYRLAADKHDYARAQNYLGGLYYHGKGDMKKDYQEAVRYFRKAAAQGNTHALNNLGVCYEEGLGVMRDYAVAKEHYKKASEGNHASGMNNLGYLNLLEKNYEEAVRCFYLATSLGSHDALYNLGTVYESGVYHPKRYSDVYMAFKFYAEAANKNYDKAILKTVDMLLNGIGCDKNIQRAVEYLEKGAHLDQPEAQYKLAQLLELGVGLEGGKKLEESRRWYVKAASHNHAGGMYFLAGMYETGIGCEKDLEKAVKLYGEAARKGHPDAARKLKEMEHLVSQYNHKQQLSSIKE